MSRIASLRFKFLLLLLALVPVVIQASTEGDAFLRAARKIKFTRTWNKIHRRDVDSNCEKWECPNGATPQQNPSYVKSSNGCGTYGISFQFMNDVATIKTCCNNHDICYDTCGKVHTHCDDDLYNCINDFCTQEYANDWWNLLTCRSVASAAWYACQGLGCSAFSTAQKGACKC